VDAADARADAAGDWPVTSPGEATRAGFAALIGAPNAGKSTLLNALVGAKVSIVSRKVQTTRALVRGIAIEGAQIEFVARQGLFSSRGASPRPCPW
jgi:GTP-binding protein Era